MKEDLNEVAQTLIGILSVAIIGIAALSAVGCGLASVFWIVSKYVTWLGMDGCKL